MSANGHPETAPADARVLRWTGRVLAAADLGRSLNGHRELVVIGRAIITPLALEQLRDRDVRITRQDEIPEPAANLRWGFAQDRPYPLVASAVQALGREGLALRELAASSNKGSGRWARALAESVARGDWQGSVVFCQDPALVSCLANKVPGLRAAAVASIAQAAQASLTLRANLVAVEMPGRTFFEVRQILRSVCGASGETCPSDLGALLGELDGHAHC